MKGFITIFSLLILMNSCNSQTRQSNNSSGLQSLDSCFDYKSYSIDKYFNKISFPLNKLDSLSNDFIEDKESVFTPFNNCDYKLFNKFDYYLKNKTDFQCLYLSKQLSIADINLIIIEIKVPCSNSAYLYTFNKNKKVDSLLLVSYGCTAHPDRDFKFERLIINYIGRVETSYFNKDTVKIISKSYYDLLNSNSGIKIKDVGEYEIKVFKIQNDGTFKQINLIKGTKKNYVDKVWSTI